VVHNPLKRLDARMRGNEERAFVKGFPQHCLRRSPLGLPRQHWIQWDFRELSIETVRKKCQ
jgi:hypothetical protein